MMIRLVITVRLCRTKNVRDGVRDRAHSVKQESHPKSRSIICTSLVWGSHSSQRLFKTPGHTPKNHPKQAPATTVLMTNSWFTQQVCSGFDSHGVVVESRIMHTINVIIHVVTNRPWTFFKICTNGYIMVIGDGVNGEEYS